MQALTWLRCPVQLFDTKQRIVWHGLVNDVVLAAGAISIGVSLDPMANSVRVAFASANGADPGTRTTTPGATDAESIAEYGTKELTVSLGDGSLLQANQLRDIVLSQRRFPVPTPGLGDANAVATATLQCRGWWSTLDWRNYAKAAVAEKNESFGGGNAYMDFNSTNTGLAQSFRFASGLSSEVWAVDTVDMLVGTFTQPLALELRSNTSLNVPGALLATSTSLASGGVDIVANDRTLTRFTFPTSVNLQGNPTYWLQFNNAGAEVVIVNVQQTDVYPRGELLRKVAGVWTQINIPNWDAYFVINGVEQTTQQIGEMVTASGQFLTGTDVLTPSGVWANPYRDGDKSALSEIADLLKAGSVSAVRILANVTPARRVQLYAEPAAMQVDYWLDGKGQLYDASRNPIGAELCPVGVWVGLKDVLPPSISLSRLAPVSPFFVESASVDVRSGKWRPQPRGTDSPFKISGLSTP
jgi:hypothetical protein